MLTIVKYKIFYSLNFTLSFINISILEQKLLYASVYMCVYIYIRVFQVFSILEIQLART